MCVVDVTATLEATAEPEQIYRVVADLSTYPDWLDIVPRAVAVEPAPSDTGPAWSVDLRGSIGPLRRSKRLRMVRTVDRPGSEAVFERAETDGREHSPWVMTAQIESGAAGSVRLTMSLHYGGSLWVPLLDRLLSDEIERSRPRLLAVAGAE